MDVDEQSLMESNGSQLSCDSDECANGKETPASGFRFQHQYSKERSNTHASQKVSDSESDWEGMSDLEVQEESQEDESEGKQEEGKVGELYFSTSEYSGEEEGEIPTSAQGSPDGNKEGGFEGRRSVRPCAEVVVDEGRIQGAFAVGDACRARDHFGRQGSIGEATVRRVGSDGRYFVHWGGWNKRSVPVLHALVEWALEGLLCAVHCCDLIVIVMLLCPPQPEKVEAASLSFSFPPSTKTAESLLKQNICHFDISPTNASF